MKQLLFHRRGAFTLVELLISISIIGILITLVTVSIIPVQKRGRDSKRKADINLALSGVDLFKADFKIYPNSTFYLGNNTTDTGAANSNFNIAADVLTCNPLNNGGTQKFTGLTNPTATQLDSAVMLPGFVSVNHFLICLKYMTQGLADPTGQTTNLAYQYRVSYDYVDAVLSTALENTNDKDLTTLLNPNLAKRYYIGSGKNIRHLDEDSDAPASAGGFYANVNGAVGDGKYLYQCKVTNKDDRSQAVYEPVKLNTSTSAYQANSSCTDSVAGLDVIQAY